MDKYIASSVCNRFEPERVNIDRGNDAFIQPTDPLFVANIKFVPLHLMIYLPISLLAFYGMPYSRSILPELQGGRSGNASQSIPKCLHQMQHLFMPAMSHMA